jgi:magnesium transporter
LDIPSTADLLDDLEDREALEAAEFLTTDRLADILDEMEPDEAADLLGDLPPEQASEALAQMEDTSDVLPLLGYTDESAGGRMTTSYIGLRRFTTTEGAIQFLRETSLKEDIPYYLYVLDRDNRLIGVVGLRDLIVSDPKTRMEDLMDVEVILIEAGADQEDAARTLVRYDLAALPVVDESGKMLGVITHDDIAEVLEEEATEDIYRLANVGSSEIKPDSGIFEQLRSRLPWLYVSMAASLFAAWVISFFEPLIAQVAVLALFLSVVAGLGGSSANQTMTMVVRAVALGNASPREIWRVLGIQILVGFLAGLAIGTVAGVGVYLWEGNVALSLILGVSLVLNMVVAAICGSVIPLTLDALGRDPALASSVIITSFTDSLGFLFFLGLSWYFLPYLSG